MKWSEGLHKWIKNNHIRPEDGQTMWNGQRDFTGASRTTTYRLRMGRQHEMIRGTSQMDQEQPHTNWRWVDNMKWSEQLHRWIKNNHIQAEDGQTTWNDQRDFTDGSRTTTYMLRMGRQCEMVRATSQMDREQPITCWEWADNVKWSEGLHRWIENNHIQAENKQTRWNGQSNFTDGLRTTTYTLKMGRQGEMIRDFTEWLRTTTYILRMSRQCEMIRGASQMDYNHIRPEDGQTIWNGQSNFTDGSKTTTYILKMGRQYEMVRETSQMDQEQPHTNWRWVDNMKWSEQLHRWIKNNHIQAENGQTMWNGQRDFTDASRKTTYRLRMSRQGEMVRGTSRIDQGTHTGWGWADKVKWSEQLHGWIENNYILSEDGQTRWNDQRSQMHQEQTHTNWGWADNVQW